MPSKTEEYLALAQRTANGLTRYWESWATYLTTASRLYKYRFEDQLMIYAQRPDVTACAEYNLGNKRIGRHILSNCKFFNFVLQITILDIVDGSYLEQYHDYDKGVAFLNAAAVSTTYIVIMRLFFVCESSLEND